MPYNIRTEDGIEIRNIPDSVDRKSTELRNRVAQARAQRQAQAQGGQAQPQQAEEPAWMPTSYGFRVRPSTTHTGAPTVQREDGAKWYGPEQGNTGTPGWFDASGKMLDQSPGIVDQVKGAVQYGVQKSAQGASQLGSRLLGSFLGGMAEAGGVNIPERLIGVKTEDIPAALADAEAKAAQQEFQRSTGGGVLPTIISEVVDPANLAGGVVGKAVGKGLPVLKGAARYLKPAAEMAVAAVPAAVARPFEGDVSQKLTQIPTEVGLGAVFGAAVPKAVGLAGQAAERVGLSGVGRRLQSAADGMIGGTPAEPVAGAMPEQVPTAAVPEVAPVAPAAEQAITAVPSEVSQKEIGELAKKAARPGVFGRHYRRKLAEMVAANPEAEKAFADLGIEVPADVLSDSAQIRSAAGLSRSVAGSEAEAAWEATVKAATNKADDAMQAFDARFEAGGTSPGAVSFDVREGLLNARNQLKRDAGDLYQQVEQAIPKASPVQAPKLTELLTQIQTEVGEGALSNEERKLFKQAESLTYGGLLRMKSELGSAIGKFKSGPFSNVDEATIKRLYAAVAEDQLSAVEQLGGQEARAALRTANQLTAKQKGLEERMRNAFGKELEGSISQLMKSAVTKGAKGDSGQFAKLLKVVPKEMQREVVATAIADASRSGRGMTKGGFGFSEYADLYKGLRSNPPVFKQLSEVMGPEATKTMRDLFEVSRRITDARARVLQTGKANQALANAMGAENLVYRIIRGPVRVAGTMAGAAAGPVGAAAGGRAAEEILAALPSGGKNTIAAVGNLFNSPEFKALVVESAVKPIPKDASVIKMVKSPAWKDYAKQVGITSNEDDAFAYIMNTIRAKKEKESR